MPFEAGSSPRGGGGGWRPKYQRTPLEQLGAGMVLQNQRYGQERQMREALQYKAFQQQNEMIQQRAGEQRFRDFQEQMGKGLVEWSPMAQKNLAQFDKSLSDLEVDNKQDDESKLRLRQELLKRRGEVEKQYHDAGLFKRRQVDFMETPEGQKMQAEQKFKMQLEDAKAGNTAFKTALTDSRTALGNVATSNLETAKAAWEAGGKKGAAPTLEPLDQTDVTLHALSQLANSGQMNLAQAQQLVEYEKSYPDYVTGDQGKQEYRRASRIAHEMVNKQQQAAMPQLSKSNPQSQAMFDAMPPGTEFFDADTGKKRTKPAPVGEAQPAAAPQQAPVPATTQPRLAGVVKEFNGLTKDSPVYASLASHIVAAADDDVPLPIFSSLEGMKALAAARKFLAEQAQAEADAAENAELVPAKPPRRWVGRVGGVSRSGTFGT